MATSSTQRQRKHRQKMKDLSLTLVQIWVPEDRVLELRSVGARMRKEGSQDIEPSARQLAFAQFLCHTKGVTLTQEQLSSSKKLFKWLNENRKKPDRVKGGLNLTVVYERDRSTVSRLRGLLWGTHGTVRDKKE
jgi:hypothetical protein